MSEGGDGMIKRDRVDRYIDDMRTGEMLFEGDEVLEVPAGSVVDGQHRVDALIDDDGSQGRADPETDR
jgi:hypothetical protein